MRLLTMLACLLWTIPAFANEPLSIESIRVEATIDGRLARTTVKHVFRNNTARRRAAHFDLRLSDHAAITRLAMSVNGELVEGEVVGRARAREVYDGIVRSQRDPALLEWQAPGEYTLDIFPIEPGERKEVVLSYSELLPVRAGAAAYRFDALIGESDTIERFVVDLTSTRPVQPTAGPLKPGTQVGFDVYNVARQPVAVRVPLRATPQVWVDPEGKHYVADLPVEVPAANPAARPVVLVVDTSASLDPELATARRVAEKIAAQPHKALRIVHGAMRAEVCSTAVLPDCFAQMERRGATDLSALIEAAAAVATELGGDADIVLVTDGRVTHGALDPNAIVAPATRVDGTVVHVLAEGQDVGTSLLTRVADAGRGHYVHMDVADVGSALLTARLSPRIWEADVRGTQRWVGHGSRLTVLGSAGAPIEAVVAGKSVSHRAGAAPTNEAARDVWVRETMVELERRADTNKKLERLAVRHGVLSRNTSYLVLEDQAAFDRHRIVRRQHAARTDRGASRPPRIVVRAATVMGSLDKEMIRRVIRSRTRAIQSCYEGVLRSEPQLAGTMTVTLAVEDGRMQQVGVRKDEPGSGPLRDCVLEQIRTLRFPKVRGGGLVTVRYPLSFAPGAKSDAPRPRATRVSRDIEALLGAGRVQDAGALLTAFLRRHDRDSAHHAAERLEAFDAQGVRDAFVGDFRNVALDRAHRPIPPPGLVTSLADGLLAERDVAGLLKLPAPPAALLRWFLNRSVHFVSVPELRALFAHWSKSATNEQRIDAIVGHPVLEVALATEFTRAVLASATPIDDAVDAMARVANVTKLKREAAAYVIRKCAEGPPSAQCVARLRALRGLAEVQPEFRRQHARRLAFLEQRRLASPGDAAVLSELGTLLAEVGERDRAEDIVWEIVEFSPQSDQAREHALDVIEGL